MLISFVVVLLLLTGGTAALYYFSSQIPVNHLPTTIPEYSAPWGRYVPADFVQVAFQNFTLSRAINSSIPADNTILQLFNPDFTVQTHQLNAIESVTLSRPNQTVDIAFLAPSVYSLFNNTLFAKANYTASYSGIRLYFVGNRFNSTAVEFGWIAPVAEDHAVVYSIGYGPAQTAVEKVLATVVGDIPSVLSLEWVDREVYIVNGTSGHIALGFENFPGIVRTSNLTGIFVDPAGAHLAVSNIVGFNSTSFAVSQYGYVKSVYRTFTSFRVYDAFVKVSLVWPASNLEEAIRLVGTP